MARPGVIYSEVAKAATQLTAQQVRPSIEAVRRILGTGSNSTISRHLRDWQQKQGVTTALEQGLPESLLVAVRGVYDALQEQANTQLNQVKAEHQEIIHPLKTRMKQLEAQQAQRIQENKNLQTALIEREQNYAALERRLDDQKANSEKQATAYRLLMERSQDKQAEIKQFEKLLVNAQFNLEHYRETIREERQQEKNARDEKVSILEQQWHQQQQNLVISKETVARLEQKVAMLEGTNKDNISLLSTTRETAQLCAQDLQQEKFKVEQLAKTQATLRSEQERLAHQTMSDAAKISELTIIVERQKEQIAQQVIALNKAESALKQLSDQHLFLTHEKAQLVVKCQNMLELS